MRDREIDKNHEFASPGSLSKCPQQQELHQAVTRSQEVSVALRRDLDISAASRDAQSQEAGVSSGGGTPTWAVGIPTSVFTAAPRDPLHSVAQCIVIFASVNGLKESTEV